MTDAMTRDDYKRLADELGELIPRFRDDQSIIDEAVKALRATSVKAGEVVAVRPLEWVQPDGPEGESWHGNGTKKCQYYIRFDSDTASYWLLDEQSMGGDDDFGQEFLALDDAKAAAQSDFKSRILSQVIVEPMKPPKAGEVIKLKWEEECEPFHPEIWTAQSIFGEIYVCSQHDNPTAYSWGSDDFPALGSDTVFPTADAAKAAAQADYESRIRSALVVEPVKGEPVAWRAFCSKTGGEMVRPASLKGMLIEEARIYRDHGYELQPLYTAPTASVGAMRALRQIAPTTKGYPNASREGQIAQAALDVAANQSDVEALAATTAERPGTVTSEPEPFTSDTPPAPQAVEAVSERWVCAARQRGIALDPQDCDWPVCGCDPMASKVLDAIAESGFKIVPKDEVVSVDESAEFEKAWANRPWTTTRTDKERAFYWWSQRALLGKSRVVR